MAASPARLDLSMGVTERLTQQAVEGLHGNEPGDAYADQSRAREIASEA